MSESFGVKERRFIGELGENVLRVLVGVAREVREGFNLAQCSKPSFYRRPISPAPSLDGDGRLQAQEYERIANFERQITARQQEINQPIQASDALGSNAAVLLEYRAESRKLGRRKLLLFDSREHLRKQTQVMGGFLDRSCAL